MSSSSSLLSAVVILDECFASQREQIYTKKECTWRCRPRRMGIVALFYGSSCTSTLCSTRWRNPCDDLFEKCAKWNTFQYWNNTRSIQIRRKTIQAAVYSKNNCQKSLTIKNQRCHNGNRSLDLWLGHAVKVKCSELNRVHFNSRPSTVGVKYQISPKIQPPCTHRVLPKWESSGKE